MTVATVRGATWVGQRGCDELTRLGRVLGASGQKMPFRVAKGTVASSTGQPQI